MNNPYIQLEIMIDKIDREYIYWMNQKTSSIRTSSLSNIKGIKCYLLGINSFKESKKHTLFNVLRSGYSSIEDVAHSITIRDEEYYY